MDPMDRKRRRGAGEVKGKRAPKPPKRKKMYSDFVGVTYNKTHAKFQACITHYRKQHYLGRYKLACDAARAYDQSAKLLKGNGWKINFATDDEYEAAKEKEFRVLEEKRCASGIDAQTLRKTYAATFPSEETLREKLGLGKPDPSLYNAQSQGQFPQQQPFRPPVPTQASISSKESASGLGRESSGSSATTASSAGTSSTQQLPRPEAKSLSQSTTQQSQSQGMSAVTPSPNVQNLNKSSTLMNEPLMSPGFKGASPSGNSLLSGTPFSIPGSSVKFNSSAKPSSFKDKNPNELDTVSTSMFQSPDAKMKIPTTSTDKASVPAQESSKTSTSENTDTDASLKVKEDEKGDTSKGEEGKEPEKGKGDLAAASALLMIGN